MEMELITNANKLVNLGLNYLLFDYNKQIFTTTIRLLKTTMSIVGVKPMFPSGLKN